MGRAYDLRVLAAGDRETGALKWVLPMPRRSVAECDPMLAEQIGKCDAESAFEELCVLYVAMTRARAGLYLITSFQGKNRPH